MVQVKGSNLCERQHDLNRKVNEAATNKVNFNNIKDEPDNTDLDRLFKIDLAAKYKTVDYIVETLKSGDSLYVSRALKKSLWLFDDEFSSIINTDYLHQKVFPFMSLKMKKKLLTAVSVHLKNENSAEAFFKYCMLGKLTIIAEKFLIKTSETFKLNHLLNNAVNNDIKYLKNLIGNSFILLEAYLTKHWEWHRYTIVKDFQYLYTVSSDQYLDLLEKNVNNNFPRDILGLRVSKDIMIKHKDRVIQNPKLYMNVLNMSKIVRHSKSEDAKKYIIGIISNRQNFWDINFYCTYKPIIEILPYEERYAFIKKTFSDNYPSQEFEMSKQFYEQEYYKLMSSSEQEVWALRHIENGKELLGTGCDYMWYKFVNFETAFREIIKLIKKSKDQTKRRDILTILIESAKSQRELEKLLNYYYERHVNEAKNNKEYFLRKIITFHKVFEFDDTCWAAFNKLLSSLRVYDTSSRGGDPEFKIVSIIYHILNTKELPDALIQYLDSEMSSYSFKIFITELNEEKKQIIYNYLFNYYLERIKKFNPDIQDESELESTKSKVSIFIHYILEFMALYKKTKHDIPEIVMKFVKLDWKSYRYQQILEEESEEIITQTQLLKLLKTDATLVVDQLPKVKGLVSTSNDFKITRFLQILKIYFADDVALAYSKIFHEILLDKNLYISGAENAVFGIFQLDDVNENIDFMRKFAPENAKIDYKNVDFAMLNIQRSICRFACYSRPPVPLSEMLKYLKGDYVPYCLPIFSKYLSNLPQPLCLKFVESIIDAPISIQKHGLRLAFKCFNAENLKKLILDSWKKTKNVTLRSVIYKAFFQKTVEEDSKELFEGLKTLTVDLHDDDDDDIFVLLTSDKLSKKYLGEFIEVVWITVKKLSNKESNLQRKSNVISCIDRNINLIEKDTVKGIVNDYLSAWLSKSDDQYNANEDFNYLSKVKRELVTRYIVFFTSSELERQENIELTKLIIKHFVENWDMVHNGLYVNRRLCLDFIDNLREKSYYNDYSKYKDVNPISEAILEDLTMSLPLHEIYMVVWDLHLVTINRNLIQEGRQSLDSENTLETVYEVAVKFGKETSNLVKKFVENRQYYSHFTSDISELINNYAYKINAYIPLNDCANIDRVLVSIARGLLEIDIVETRILALQLLPENLDEYYSDNNINDLNVVFEKIKDNADMEIKCFIHNKYYRDCKRRRFI